MTSLPVEREDNCECLEMLRWTEAISSTNTAPASLPAPSRSLTDFLLWVFVRLCVSFLPAEVNARIRMPTVSIPFLFQPIRQQPEILCLKHVNTQTRQIPESLHCTTLIHACFNSCSCKIWKEVCAVASPSVSAHTYSIEIVRLFSVNLWDQNLLEVKLNALIVTLQVHLVVGVVADEAE